MVSLSRKISARVAKTVRRFPLILASTNISNTLDDEKLTAKQMGSVDLVIRAVSSQVVKNVCLASIVIQFVHNEAE